MLSGSDRKYREVDRGNGEEGGGVYTLSTHAQWKSHLLGISLIASSELNKEKRGSNHFRQTLYGIMCHTCDDGSNDDIKGRKRQLINAFIFS